jgi:hypothetical protein
MNLARYLAVALISLLIGCGEPVPADRAAYVGAWKGKDISLLITQDGRVDYQRRSGSGSTSVKAPIQRFEGNNFVVGVGPFSTTFVVSKPPYLDGSVWKMVVDGVELARGVGEGDSWKA